MEIGPLHDGSKKNPEVISEVQQKVSLPAKSKTEDSVVISENAREKLAKLADAALSKYGLGDMPSMKTEKDDPDLRIDKIKLAKERIESGYYRQYNVVEKIADKLANGIIESFERDKDQD